MEIKGVVLQFFGQKEKETQPFWVKICFFVRARKTSQIIIVRTRIQHQQGCFSFDLGKRISHSGQKSFFFVWAWKTSQMPTFRIRIQQWKSGVFFSDIQENRIGKFSKFGQKTIFVVRARKSSQMATFRTGIQQWKSGLFFNDFGIIKQIQTLRPKIAIFRLDRSARTGCIPLLGD